MIETKKIIMPKGKQSVEVKTFLSAREEIGLQKPLLEKLKLDIDAAGAMKTNEISAWEASRIPEETLIKTVVVSIDTIKEDILNKVLDFISSDYKFLIKELDKIVKGENFQLPIKKQKDNTK